MQLKHPSNTYTILYVLIADYESLNLSMHRDYSDVGTHNPTAMSKPFVICLFKGGGRRLLLVARGDIIYLYTLYQIITNKHMIHNNFASWR